VRDGLNSHGLPIDAHRRATQNVRSVPLVHHLLVYGTLQSGHGRADVLSGIADRQPARITGRLFDLGAYPGWQPGGDATHALQGELLELTDPVAALSVADAIEGCAGYRNEALYHRVLVRAVCADEENVVAWCYRVANIGDAPVIASGRWAEPKQGSFRRSQATRQSLGDIAPCRTRRKHVPSTIFSSPSGVPCRKQSDGGCGA